MKKFIGTSVCAAAVACAGVIAGAQTTSSSQTSTASPSSSTEQKVVVTGCLREAPQSAASSTSGAATGTSGSTTAGTTATGTSGTMPPAGASAGASTPSYVLADATVAPASSEPSAAAGTTATGTTGTTAGTTAGTTGTEPTPPASASSSTASSASSSKQTYRLIANATALTPHVGKKVELTGVLEDQKSSASTTAGEGGPALRVTAGKVIANSCQN